MSTCCSPARKHLCMSSETCRPVCGADPILNSEACESAICVHILCYNELFIYIYIYIHIHTHTHTANMPFKIVGETLFPCLATLSAVPFFWLWMPHPPTSVVVRTNERGPSIQVKEGASEAHERDSQINTGLKSKFYFKKDSVISLVHELHQSCLATISTSLVWWLFVSKSHSHQKACNDHSSNTPVTNPIPCSL